jgi:hypothetical protein
MVWCCMYGWVVLCGGVVGVGNLCYSWVEFFIEIRFNSLTSHFVLGFEFCSCWS